MKKIFSKFGEYLALLMACLIVLSLTTRLFEADMFIPFGYGVGGDNGFMITLFKGVVDNGWYLENPYIGAPIGQHFYDFPATQALNYLIIKFLSFFFSDYAVTMNVFYILVGFLLTCVTSFGVFRHFRISFTPALIGSLLYVFIPFHFIRGLNHFFLAIYFIIPLGVMVVLWIFSRKDLLFGYDSLKGEVFFNPKSTRFWWAAGICLLVSFSGVYTAFFILFFFVIAAIYSLLLRKNYNFFNALILVSIILSGIMAEMLPSIVYQIEHGSNIVKRSPSEAEMYGLKVTQLLLPANYHRIPQLAQFTDNYSKTAPLVTENYTATLGIVGSVGFLFLLGWILFYRRFAVSETIEYLSVLNLSAILLATVGGFASLFTYLTHFQIRGYNRISIFIAFFSLLAIGFLFEKWRENWNSTQSRQVMFYVFMAIILIAGLLDQSPRPGAPNHNKAQYLQDKQFVKSIEANLPKNIMIFQLPYIPFPEHPSVHKMTDYEHFKGYLHSTHLRWSYGAPRGREGDIWQKQTAAKSPKKLIETIVFTGFGGLWLDRFGYADNGTQLVREFNLILGTIPVESKDQRYVFWDLTNLKNIVSSDEWKQKSINLQASLSLNFNWGKGFSGEEKNDKNIWRWSEKESELIINNSSKNPMTVLFSTKFVTPGDKITAIKIEGDLINEEIINQTQNIQDYSKKITVPQGKHLIKFSTTAKQLISPDPRKIFFGLHDYRLDVLKEDSEKKTIFLQDGAKKWFQTIEEEAKSNYKSGNFEVAKVNYLKHLNLSEQLGDQKAVAEDIVVLLEIYEKLREFSHGLELVKQLFQTTPTDSYSVLEKLYRKNLVLNQHLNNIEEINNAHVKLIDFYGSCYFKNEACRNDLENDINLPELIEQAYLKKLEFANNTPDYSKQILADDYLQLGHFYTRTQNWSKVKDNYQKAFDLYTLLDNKVKLIETHSALLRYSLFSGEQYNLRDEIETRLKIVELCKATGNLTQLEDEYQKLIELYELLNEHEQAQKIRDSLTHVSG